MVFGAAFFALALYRGYLRAKLPPREVMYFALLRARAAEAVPSGPVII